MESLRRDECDLAIAGGVHLNLNPDAGTALAELGLLSPDGICRPFDRQANGYLRGEGGGFVVLKRIADAVEQGDHIYSVILGGAVINDGRRQSLASPDSDAHGKLFRAALTASGVEADAIQYVEAHGTGTPVGDIAEAEAITVVYSTGRSEHPLFVGSLKANIGHLEAAAGVLGIIKVALALQHRLLPPSLNFVSPNAALVGNQFSVRVLSDTTQWPVTGRRRTAAVSSFGISGTNAHVIVQQAPDAAVTAAPPADAARPLLWPLSARTPNALAAQADRLHQHLLSHPDLDLTEVAYSLATTRTHHRCRATVVNSSTTDDPRTDLLAALRALSTDQPHRCLTQHHNPPHPTAKTVFVFPGQGSQYPGMGLELYQHQPTFAHTLDEICAALDTHLDIALRDILFAAPHTRTAALLEHTAYAQPALFALGAAMHALLVDLGITPDYLLGHSIGELTAAYVAGVWSLPDAAALVTTRGRLMQACPPATMLAIHAGAPEVTALLTDHPHTSIAAINGPTSVVVSGPTDELDHLRQHCAAHHLNATPLPVNRAFHSAYMDPALPEFEATAATLTYHPPTVATLSNLTGGLATPAQLTSPSYWTRQLREPVRFHDSVIHLLTQGPHTFIELSPHPVLAPAITDTLAQSPDHTHSTVITTAHRDRPATDTLATALAHLHNHRHSPTWPTLYPHAQPTALPTYPFQHHTYWLHPTPSADLSHPRPLQARLAGQTPDQQLQTVTALVGSAAGVVLAHLDPSALDGERTFKDLGTDSFTAVELRNVLIQQTGLALPPTLVFDYPTPAALARYLVELLTATEAPAGAIAAAAPRVDEPVAVVGMACRFPGGVDSAQGLWELVITGRDVVGDFPTDRGWDLAELFDPDPDAVGKTYARSGAFLADAAGFDAEFFGISAREAFAIDPQQRLLLEICWEALETAGIDPASLAGSSTAVFAGTWAQPYGAGTGDGFALTGTATSVASGRVAYALGLQGPAITVDTACSSSLVATHLACESLRNGESGLALAGGVTVMATPAIFTEFARQRGLAPDGRCKAFAEAADGTGWGEGAGMLVLERLSDARRNNRTVLAVIAGSAINQDGASNGLTAPNGPAQQRVIRQAVANAGLTLDQVDVVEAHGTGTALGDPVEAGALIATYGAARDADHPLWLGSVKSNIGHTQAAAGVAGLIKMIQALNHDTLAPTLHADRASSHIDWSSGTVRLLTEPVAWPVTGRRRTAAVSSFGISGTNAHVIVQQAPDAAVTAAPPADAARPLLWPLSARTPNALAAQADRLHQHLLSHPDLDLTEVAYSLATTRTHHRCRATVVNSSTTDDPRTDLLAALRALSTDQPHRCLTQHHNPPHPTAKTVFVFPGQGSQYPGMGLELYQHQPTFAHTLDEICAALDTHLDIALRDILFAAPHTRTAALLEHTAYAQPALFALGAAMHALLVDLGITPDYLLGHSIGELTAAYVAGVWSLPDAAALVTTRGRLMQACPPATMLAIHAGAPEVTALLTDHPHTSIAAINGPTSVVVSGPTDELDHLRQHCAAHHLNATPLPVNRAFHSAYMDPALPEFEATAATLTYHPPTVATLSNLTGGLATPAQLTSPSYWTRQLREPVRFHDSVIHLLTQGPHTFIELSPHPVLAPAITDTLAQSPDHTHSTVITTAHRDRPATDTLATALAHLHNHRHSPTWPTLYPHAQPTALPTYPFQHHTYWLHPTPSAAERSRPDHPLLGSVTELAGQDRFVLTGRLSASMRWLADHRVRGTVLLAHTGLIDVMLRAGEYSGCPVIEELVVHAPLALADHVPTDLQITVHPAEDDGRRLFSVYCRAAGEHTAGWTLHAGGALTVQPHPLTPFAPPQAIDPVDPDSFYQHLAGRGFDYGGPFRSVRGICRGHTDPAVVCAEVELPAGTDASGYGIHPALLDAALHPLASTFFRGTDDESAFSPVPFAFTGITLHATAATRLHVQLTSTGPDSFALYASDPAGAPVITIRSLTLRKLPDDIGQLPVSGPHDSLFELCWPVRPAAAPAAATGWAVVTDRPDRLPVSLRSGPVHADLTALGDPPELVIWPLPEAAADIDTVERLHSLTRRTLTQLQAWLANPHTLNSHLVVITRHAVAAGRDDPAPDLAHAAAWALVHTAQTEHPDRITLLDTDSSAATDETILATLAARPAAEPQLVLRNGTTHIPRLNRPSNATPPSAPALDSDGTVLITGGTGMLGRVFAEHVVTKYGAHHLLLVSRSGPASPAAAELEAHLGELGAKVTIMACDTGNPADLDLALSSIPDQHRLTAVIHAAGVLDDAVVTDLTVDQLDAVLAAKADAAWHLHQRTQDHDLAAFVMFSSATAALGGPGQANYAAANAFLDALAEHRHRRHLPATSLAWGPWQAPAGMTAHLTAADHARFSRNGFAPITTEHGLALFDAALAQHRPTLFTSPLSRPGLTRQAHENSLPAILSGLYAARPPATAELRPRLADQPADQQLQTLTSLVNTATAAVLAHPDPSALDGDRTFKELGTDSLTALELRNVLSRQTGLTLPTTLIYDHPTPVALARHLTEALAPVGQTLGPLGKLLKEASDQAPPVAIDILIAASQLDSSAAFLRDAPKQLAESVLRPAEGAAVRLVCLSEFAGQYQNFANLVREDIEVTEIVAPGFSGTALPSTARQAAQKIVDTIQPNKSADQIIVIVANGITCVPGLDAAELIATTALKPENGQTARLVTIAPVTTANPAGTAHHPLLMAAVSQHLHAERDLIAYGRYLRFGLRSNEQPDAKSTLVMHPRTGPHIETPSSPLTLEPGLVALRVCNWLADNHALN
ncbi:type I polyketide synthase [Mycobacterium sp. 94-17]|nr:type I polyketide synthase [Mycobacterium sp. 94-17]